MICETFLPRLFFGKTKTLSPVVRALSKMPVKKNRPGTPESSDFRSGEVLRIHARERRTGKGRDGRGGGELSNTDHLQTLSEDRRDRKKSWDVVYESRLKGLVRNFQVTDKRLLLRTKGTYAWLSIRGTTVSGTVLSATEFRDDLCARYTFSPVNLKRYCDGSGTAFGVTHALSCYIGSLVIVHHNEIRDELLYLS